MTIKDVEDYKFYDAESYAASRIDPDALTANSFTEKQKQYFRKRLPRFLSTSPVAICAYCGKVKDRRSMQIDHVIPLGY